MANVCLFAGYCFREGLYIRVAGHLRAFNEGATRSMIGFLVEPVADLNEITLHMLEVVHAHLFLKKSTSAVKAETGMVSCFVIVISVTWLYLIFCSDEKLCHCFGSLLRLLYWCVCVCVCVCVLRFMLVLVSPQKGEDNVV